MRQLALPAPRRLPRVVRFAGGPSVVTGDAVSVCLRLSVAFDIAGVLPDALAGPELEPDPPEACVIVLCCFCGELCAEPGAFWGVGAEGVDWGFVGPGFAGGG